MDGLERDYTSVLLTAHAPPCLSLYQPTHRTHPDKQQDPIRFRNLVKELEAALSQSHGGVDITAILAPFHELAGDEPFWNHPLDGLAVFATTDLFRVYRLQRPVRALTVVADSFHTKPLMRILQSADRYHVLGINRHEARLFEGNRDALDEVELAPDFPQTLSAVVEQNEGGPEQKKRVYGPVGPGTTGHGTNVRQDERDADTERFFRAVDEATLEQYSRPLGLPLLLAALPEHHHLFRSVTRNPHLMAEAIGTFAGAISIDELRERAWQLILPHYLERLDGLVESFGQAMGTGLASDDLAEVAKAVACGRVATLLIEADRMIPGHFDVAKGAIEFAGANDGGADDLLDDLGEYAIRSGAEAVIVPSERMPTHTGIAAIFRF